MAPIYAMSLKDTCTVWEVNLTRMSRYLEQIKGISRKPNVVWVITKLKAAQIVGHQRHVLRQNESESASWKSFGCTVCRLSYRIRLLNGVWILSIWTITHSWLCINEIHIIIFLLFPGTVFHLIDAICKFANETSQHITMSIQRLTIHAQSSEDLYLSKCWLKS